MPPKSAKRVSEYDDGDDFIASDDEITTSRPAKKARTSTLASGAPAKDSEGNLFWEISKQRRVFISEFKGKTLVNIREYYEKDGKDLPGKKGISMTLDQYSALIELLPQIEKVIKGKGESVPRPKYNGTTSTAVEDDDSMDNVEESKKSNIEATSDEDEGDE